MAAIPWLERAMRLDPLSAHHYYLDLVQALFMAGRATEAIRVLEPMESDRFEHYALLAACRSAVGDAQAAQEAGRRVLAIRPNFAIGSYLESSFAFQVEMTNSGRPLSIAVDRSPDAATVRRDPIPRLDRGSRSMRRRPGT